MNAAEMWIQAQIAILSKNRSDVKFNDLSDKLLQAKDDLLKYVAEQLPEELKQ